MLTKIIWKRKLKKFVKKTIKEGGNHYEILLNIAPNFYRVWEVENYDGTNVSLRMYNRLATLLGPLNTPYNEDEGFVSSIIPGFAIDQVLVNKIMIEYPCNGGLQAFKL